MGWTAFCATNYKNGKVDRKAEMDKEFGNFYEILKSAMVGNTYYAALKTIKHYVKDETTGEAVLEELPENERRVFGFVALTSVNSKEQCNFAYKDMSEDMLPFYYDCPMSILNLLSPTDCESALEWRRRCRENHAQKLAKKTDKNSLANLPIGTVIECEVAGVTRKLQKSSPAYQFKRPWWRCVGEMKYVPAKRIPSDYKIVA